MKFLILTNHSYMFWRFRRELTEALLERGEVVISTPFVGHEEDLMQMGCRCIETQMDRRKIDPRKEYSLFRFYRRLIREEQPDYVITYSIKPNIYGGLACSCLNVPYFVNVQGLGTMFQGRKKAAVASVLYRLALKKANIVFFENEGNAAVFQDRHIIPAEKQKILNGAGVNLEYYAEQPYPSEEDGVHFLYLGRIMREKGMDELLEAIVRLKAEYQDDVHFDLVGFFEDDYSRIIEDLVRKGVLNFSGFQSDPRPYYANAHCVVLPSHHEGMSNVLLEAAAAGRALITTDIPGCRETVTEGKNGYLVPVRDSDGIYAAMKAFLALSPQERQSMGKMSREKMKAEFDKRQIVSETLAEMQL